MQMLSKVWNNFKIQPDVWFFYGFLITFTLSIRKVVNFFPIDGQFNEYAGIYLYLSDIFSILMLGSWLISIIYNKKIELSIDKLKNIYILAPLSLILWAFLSIFWSKNEDIALFRSLKLLEFYLLYLYIIFRFKKCSTWNILMKSIMSVAVIQSIVAIFQFILQHSIGLFWLKESLISPEILGVAKVIIGGEKFIRSYGLFPHPNILGGFLLFSIIITILYQRMFHVEHSDKFLHIKCSMWNILILMIQGLALMLTFSKSAISGLILGFIYLYYRNVSRGTLLEKSRKYFKKIILIAIITVLLLSITKFDSKTFLFKSLDERGVYLNVSRGTISDNLIFGVGNGQFVLNMQSYSKQVLEFWQFQPVHNVFLLIWSELGIFGLAMFVYFLFKILWNKNVPSLPCDNKMFHVEQFGILRGGTFATNTYFKAIFVGFLFIMLFDHYLWDIQQGQIMLWMILGLIVATGDITILLTKNRNYIII